MGIERGVSLANESDLLAAKQRLLQAEVAWIHSLKGSSFLQGPQIPSKAFGDTIEGSDYSIRLHAPEETGADIGAGIAALSKAEDAKSASAAAQYNADKKMLIDAEIRKIGKIVGGNF